MNNNVSISNEKNKETAQKPTLGENQLKAYTSHHPENG